MTEPIVACVMLTRDRPEMAQRAVQCFRAQRYERKRLLIYNTNTSVEFGHIPLNGITLGGGVSEIPAGHRGLSVGAMRNAAINHTDAEIIIHWDDDDLSHPNRISEQVALLQSGDYDAVGYRSMLFWDSRKHCLKCGWVEGTSESAKRSKHRSAAPRNEAWLYQSIDPTCPLGTSLCYWRKAWERVPFPDKSQGEDEHWCRYVKALAVPMPLEPEPMMIARIHGGNVSNAYSPNAMAHDEWRRAPEWDARVAKIVEEL